MEAGSIPASGTPGQGAPAAGAQPPAGGQGAAQGQPTAAGKADAGFNWGLFPEVPVEQRELLEPHLKGIQGHVTKLEQQYAPYKGLMDSVSADQVENLIGFLNNYSNDPLNTWLGLGQQLGQDGALPQGVSFEAIQQLMQGQAQQQQPGQAQPGQEEVPDWARQMQARLDQYDQQAQQQQQAQQEAEQDQMLEQAKTGIRATLTESGISEDLVTDEMIVAAIIAANGDEQAAANMLNQMRQNFLAAFANGKATGGSTPPAVNGDLPTAQKAKGGRKGDPIQEARAGAEQFLRQQQAAQP